MIDLVALEKVLCSQWAEVVDHVLFINHLRPIIRDTVFRKLEQYELPTRRTTVQVSSLTPVLEDTSCSSLRMAAEFSMPKENGVVIGTIIAYLDFSGGFRVVEVLGTHFVPKS